MPNFGREQLLKHGWTEGKGLGKNEDGISQPVKLALKLDNAGIGYRNIFDRDLWWQALYNTAAENIEVKSHGNEVSLSIIDKNQNTMLSKKTEKNEPNLKYTNFVKADFTNSTDTPFADAFCNILNKFPARDTTVHKTKLSGKLERIARQDEMFLGVLAPGCSTSATSTSHCDTNALGLEMHHYQLREKYLSERESTCLTDAAKQALSYAEKLAQKLSTCNIKEDDARSKLEAPINKRKRNQDCVIQIEASEMGDIYFFKKKQKRSSLEAVSKVGGNQEQKSHYEQIEMGIKKLSIKQKTGSACQTNKINKQCGKQSPRRRIDSRYVKLAHMWKDIIELTDTEELTEMEPIGRIYNLIKRKLDTNKHLDLPSNIERCVKECIWIASALRKLYFSVRPKKIAVIKKQEKLERKIVEIMTKVKYNKMCTQTHLTPV